MFPDEDPSKKKRLLDPGEANSPILAFVLHIFSCKIPFTSITANLIREIEFWASIEKHIQILPFLGEILFHLHWKGQILLEDTKSLMGEVQDTHNSEHVHTFDGFGVLSFFLVGAPQFHTRTVESLEHSPRLFLSFTFQLRYLPKNPPKCCKRYETHETLKNYGISMG